VIAGKYRLERELASGGMGAVWVARHLQLDAPVALKFMSPALPDSAAARARFAREARAAARLRGPHVVQVLDHGVDGDIPYIVMELLEGEHLGERLKRERRLSLCATADIATQVGKALGRAHRAGIVHRDLKPANVFLGQLDDEVIVKLLDFGIHKVIGPRDAETTGSDVLMGSPQYMSPEQARGSKNVDHRADLWSLGAILYRALTGVPAFDGVSAVDVIVQICTSAVPVASRAAPDLPPDLDAFFFRALARDPDRRFASALEMTDAFRALVSRVERGDPAAESRGLPESGDDLLTSVMARGGAPPGRLPRPTASRAEVDAFVERAFGAMLTGAPAPVLGTDSVPPTTRCAPVRAFLPSSGTISDPPPSPTARSVAPGRVTGLWSIRAEEAPASVSPVSALIDQGFSALRRGEPDSARRAWQEALGMDPSNRALALNLRRLETRGGSRRPV
jgi:serine/threonine-protein kinase